MKLHLATHQMSIPTEMQTIPQAHRHTRMETLTAIRVYSTSGSTLDSSSSSNVNSAGDIGEGETEGESPDTDTDQEEGGRTAASLQLGTQVEREQSVRAGLLTILGVGTLAFFLIGLYTNKKAVKKDSTAKLNRTPSFTDNEDVGDNNEGSDLSALEAIGANSGATIELNAMNADASVVSALTMETRV